MKSLAIGIVLLLLTMNGIATLNGNNGNNASTEKNCINLEKTFSQPKIIQKNGFYLLNIDNCSSIIAPHKPVIPVYTKIYLFPAGTKIKVNVSIHEKNDIGKLNLMPSYTPIPPCMEDNKIEYPMYDRNMIYPERWYGYEIHSGLINGNHHTILKINLYPARYVKGDVIYAGNFNIKIEYKEPEKSIFNNNAYDLLIVTPQKFIDEANQLAQHKESNGIKTKVVNMQDIENIQKGRDNAEKLKYYIKDAIEQYGIKYILLLGGRKPGLKEDWYVPVRYVHTFWADESQYASDLYFADIYDGNYNFSSWDSNGNGIYGEWLKNRNIIDTMDLYPDVYVGRLACRNEIEAKIMIGKIIEYEDSPLPYKKVVAVGGDNFEDPNTNYYEGEVVTNKTINYLKNLGFESKKVWASQEDVTPYNIKKALGKGATFVHCHGHGSPIYWSTHKPNDFNHWQKGLSIFDAPSFFNKGYAIMAFGGCHTAMFNVSLTIHPWTGGIPVPEGLSWWFARKLGGGSIATLGFSCFPVATPGEEGDLDGDGINEPDCVEDGYGYIELEFFHGYAKGLTTLGDAFGYSLIKYADTFNCLSERWQLHTIEGFTLLGDPSLHIGGYS